MVSANGRAPDRWIVIPRWDGPDGFQHYKDRDPIFIKNYRRLLHSDAYLHLTLTQRGLLHGLWLEYAASNREIRDDTTAITRRLGQRVTRASLDALNRAGFIQFSASKPLAPRYHSRARTEKEEEKERKASLAMPYLDHPPGKARQEIEQNDDFGGTA